MESFILKVVITSSNINSIVLDPFCGSGTTLAAAASCSRKWIGIDKSDLAIDVSKKRMQIGQNILMDDSSVFVDLESNKNV